MRVLRRAAAPTAAGLLLLLVAGPAAAGGAGVQPDPAGLSVRQSVLTQLSSTGVPGTSRVFTQVATDAPGTVTLPAQSTVGLRGLSGFSRPQVAGDAVTWRFDEPGLRRAVATNDAGLPVEFDIAYTLDGEPIAPDDLVGRDGELTVTYVVRNTSGVPTEVEYVDGRGTPRTSTVDVPIPLVGSMSTVLDDRFGEVAAPGAAVVGDGRGNTVVNWSLVLFAPLGAEEVSVSYTARVRDAVVPATSAQVIPVTSRSFGSMSSAAATYGDAAESTTALTDGAGEIHANLKALADGAGELLTGLGSLAAGATELSTGLGDAASGSGDLAEGMGQAAEGGAALATGLGDLDAGAGQLAEGLGSAHAGGAELGSGLSRLATGAGELAGGLTRARTGAAQLAAGLAALDAGAAELHRGAGTLSGGAGELARGADLLDTKTGELVAGTRKLAAGADDLTDGLVTLRSSLNADDGLPAAQDGAEQLAAGVDGLVAGIGSTATSGTLLNGLFRLSAGLSNSACALTAPEDPTNPCGVKQVLQLLELGMDNPAAFADGPGQNLTCVDPADDPTKHPCGADQALTLIDGGLAEVGTGAGALEQGAGALGAGVGGDVRTGIIGLGDGARSLGDASVVVGGALATVQDEAGSLSHSAQTALATATVANDQIGTGLAGLAAGADGLVAGLGTPLDPGVDPATVCGPALAEYGTLVASGSSVPVLLGLKVIECGAAAIEIGVGQADAPGTLLAGTAQLRAGVAEAAAALVTLQAKLGDSTTADTIVNGVARIMMGLDNPAAFAGGAGANPGCLPVPPNALQPCGVKQGLQLVAGGLDELGDGLGDALASLNAGLGSVAVPGETLLYGAASLLAGAEELSAGAARLRSEGTGPLAAGAGDLADGAARLADGAGDLAAGATAAATGGRELAGGIGQLDDGGRQLAGGAAEASAGAGSLVTGLGQLRDGGTALAAGAGEAAAGAGDLRDGLGQLDGGANELADGLGAAAEGSTSLADGLGKAHAGGDRLADGSQLLVHQGTGVLTESVNDAAADTALTVAQLAAVDARGATEGLPYGVPEGASASAVYAFEIAGVAGSRGLSEPGRAATAAGVFGLTGALGMLGRRRFGLV